MNSLTERRARLIPHPGAPAVPARLSEGRWVRIDDLFAQHPLDGDAICAEADAVFAAPVDPRVVVAMAHNGTPADRLSPPQCFLKSARTAIGPGEPIAYEGGIGLVGGEAEVALVIGTDARHLTRETATAAVLGWTVANDVTGLDQVPLDSFFTQAKNGNGWTPIGPWIELGMPPADLTLSTTAPGVQREGQLADLGWDPIDVLVFVSSIMPLGPGDVVLLGAPGTFIPVQAGEDCVARAGQLTLRNPVVATAPRAPLPV